MLFSLFTLILAPSSFADTHLMVRGKTLGDGALIYNCLSYQACDLIDMTLGTKNQVHLYVDRELAQIQSQLSRCDLSAFKGSVQVILSEGSKTLELKPSKETLNLSPAIPSALNPTQVARQRDEVNQLLSTGKTQQAVEKVVQMFGLERFSYDWSFSEEMTKKDMAITNHEKKTITLPHQYANICDLFHYVRHEYEHVQQVELVEKCYSKQRDQSFVDHNMRERIAYLSDIAASTVYCPQQTPLITASSIANIQQRYMKKAPSN